MWRSDYRQCVLHLEAHILRTWLTSTQSTTFVKQLQHLMYGSFRTPWQFKHSLTSWVINWSPREKKLLKWQLNKNTNATFSLKVWNKRSNCRIPCHSKLYPLKSQLHGYAATWLCGYMAMRLNGYAATQLHDYAATWLQS